MGDSQRMMVTGKMMKVTCCHLPQIMASHFFSVSSENTKNRNNSVYTGEPNFLVGLGLMVALNKFLGAEFALSIVTAQTNCHKAVDESYHNQLPLRQSEFCLSFSQHPNLTQPIFLEVVLEVSCPII